MRAARMTGYTRMPETSTYSFGEIEAHVKKAVRGAGFSWGHAEETGKAIRILESHGLPGVAALAAYLSVRGIGKQIGRMPQLPALSSGCWLPPQGTEGLCPILISSLLIDFGQGYLDSQQQLELKQVYSPLLILPAALLLARHAGQSIQVSVAGECIVCTPSERINADLSETRSLMGCKCADVVLECSGAAYNPEDNLPLVARAHLKSTDWEILDGFARNTYVPATEASRQGAGPAE